MVEFTKIKFYLFFLNFLSVGKYSKNIADMNIDRYLIWCEPKIEKDAYKCAYIIFIFIKGKISDNNFILNLTSQIGREILFVFLVPKFYFELMYSL